MLLGANLCPRSVEMGQADSWQAGKVAFAVVLADVGEIKGKSLGCRHTGGIVARAQEGQRIAHAHGFGTAARGKGQKKMIVVGLVVLCARHRAPYIYIVWFEQGGGSFEARRGIVVACNGHYLQTGQAARGFGEKVVKHLLGRSRGIGGVENVAGNQQSVRLLLAKHAEQPVQEMPMLISALMPVKLVAEMPVGGMDKFHFPYDLFSWENARAYILICFTIASRPLLRVGLRCSVKPIWGIK